MRIPIYCQPLPCGQIADSRAAATQIRAGDHNVDPSIRARCCYGGSHFGVHKYNALRRYTGVRSGWKPDRSPLECKRGHPAWGEWNVFQNSSPLFGTEPVPKQTSELLHISSVGVNPSSRSSVSGAFASSLAESNGNGGVGNTITLIRRAALSPRADPWYRIPR